MVSSPTAPAPRTSRELGNCSTWHLRLSRHNHRLLRVRPYRERRGPLRAGSVSQRVGQARPGRAVRILAVHARPSEAVIPCVGDATLRNRAIYRVEAPTKHEVMINL